MKEETTKEVSTELYSMLGYDQASKRVRMGMLAEKTHPYIMEKVVEMLMSEFKFSKEEATEVMDKTWKDTPENMQIKSTGNLGLLFKTLKEQGLLFSCIQDLSVVTLSLLQTSRSPSAPPTLGRAPRSSSPSSASSPWWTSCSAATTKTRYLSQILTTLCSFASNWACVPAKQSW